MNTYHWEFVTSKMTRYLISRLRVSYGTYTYMSFDLFIFKDVFKYNVVCDLMVKNIFNGGYKVSICYKSNGVFESRRRCAIFLLNQLQ